MTAELIVVGARVRTLDPGRPWADAVAVRDEVVVAVGDKRDVMGERGTRTEVLELPGATLLPGLVDGHTHPLLGADNTVGADLNGCSSRDDVVAALRREAARGAGGWVRGWGLDPNVLGEPVHRGLLDEAVGDRPAFVYVFDGHAGVTSTRGLALAGVGGAPDVSPPGVVLDDLGRPTGHLLEEEAIGIVLAAVPRPGRAEREARLAAVLADMAVAGLTGGHVMDLDGVDTDADLDVYRALDERGDLPLRLRLLPWCRPGDGPDRMAALVDLQRHRGRLWQVAGVKLFLDGTVDGGTAWLTRPDTVGASSAPAWPDPAAYTRAVHALAAAGVATATHAIGDRAVAHVLDTLATAPAGARAPHRVEHVETLEDDQVPRFARLGVVASMQPTHATDYTRADGSDEWSRRLGPERASRGWRCADLVEAGATLVLGSDWPVAPADPRGILAAATSRRSPVRPELPPVQPGQALTPLQALLGLTRAPAAAAGDATAGRIAVGYRADFTALAADPVVVPAEELPSVPVVATVVGGVVRFRG